MADGEHGAGRDIERHAQGVAQLAGDEASRNGADGPARFEKAEAARAGMQNVIDQGDEDDVAADDASHHDRVSDSKRAHEGLLLKIGKAFLEIGVDGKREAGFSDFGIFARLQGFRGGFGGFGIFAWIFQMFARRDVAAADAVETKCGDEVSQAVDAENSGDARTVVKEADECAGDEHAALDADEDGGVCTGELAWRYDFLHESVDGGPVHRRAGAGDQRHGVEMPEMEIAAPCDISGGENEKATD